MKNLIAAAAIIVTSHAYSQEPPADAFAWKCKGTGRDSMQCAVVNNTAQAGELCVDVVKVCKDGEHVAKLCSGSLQSGESASKVVHGFFPKVKLFDSCMGVEYRDRKILR